MCLASTTRYPANKLQLTENCIHFDNLVESRQCLYYCIIPAKLKSIFRKVLLLSNWHKNVLKPPSFLFVSLVQLLASSGDTIIGFPIHGRKRSEKTLSWEITCINTNATHIPNLMPTLNQGQKNMLASRKQQKCLSLFPFEANILSKQIFLQKYHNLATFIECLKSNQKYLWDCYVIQWDLLGHFPTLSISFLLLQCFIPCSVPRLTCHTTTAILQHFVVEEPRWWIGDTNFLAVVIVVTSKNRLFRMFFHIFVFIYPKNGLVQLGSFPIKQLSFFQLRKSLFSQISSIANWKKVNWWRVR